MLYSRHDITEVYTMAYKYQPIKDEIFVSDNEDEPEENGDKGHDEIADEFDQVSDITCIM